MLMYLAFTVQTCRLMCVVSLCCVIVIVPRTFLLRYSSKIYSWYKKYIILLVAIENQKLMDLFYCTSKEGSVGGQTVVLALYNYLLTLSSKLLMM